MIFGDRDEFALEIHRFDPPWQDLDAEAGVLWAAIAVWISGTNITEHRRHGTDRVRDNVHAPLLSLARWCAGARSALRYEERSPLGNLHSPHEELDRWSWTRSPAGLDEDAWLDRRDAWWSRHFTGSATADVMAPSVGLVRNDDRALISWRAPRLPRVDRSFVVPNGTASVSWNVAQAALTEFVEAVESWAPSSVHFAATADSSSALEYYTGLTTAELPAFGFRREAAEDPAVDPLAQVVRDLTHRTATGPAQQGIVDFVRAADRAGNQDWWALRQKLVATGVELERDGYDAAQAVRSLLDLDGQPVVDVQRLARGLDVQLATESLASASDRMLVVGGQSTQATLMVLSGPRTETDWGARFEVARGLGHLVLDPLRGDAVGAASGPQAMATRRRRSGAFAAEFLLPSAALVEASDGALDGISEGTRFPDLLRRFGVGAHTAAFHLWNQGLLSSAEVRDDLIASV